MDKKSLKSHILQQLGVLIEFDIISSTSLEEFMETYKEIAESSDDISELNKVSSLLNKKEYNKNGIYKSNNWAPSGKKDPSLDKLAVALIEFIIKKTQDPEDWTYIINYMVEKLGLEFEDDDDAEGDI